MSFSCYCFLTITETLNGKEGLMIVEKRNVNQLISLVGQLSASGIDIFAPASSNPDIHPVLGQMIGEALSGFFIWFCKTRAINIIVLDHIYQMGRNLSVDLYKVIGIFDRIIQILEKNIL